ncbi:MAG: glutamine synthetase family protein [Candidatus ainarchaeum sp.]|nr:glutamine synthetase family protein [Candidatus ainarchaeum sp.]
MKAGVLKRMDDAGIKFVNLQFIDIQGAAKATDITPKHFEGSIDDGLWFDGSSIEGFARIFESDMLLKPDLRTFAILPASPDTATVMCDVYSDEGTPFAGDPRHVLKRALAKAREAGFEFKVGPELEFFLFKTNGDPAKPAAAPHDAAGYFDLSPLDLAVEVRKEIIPMLGAVGIEVEMGHHEVAAGQHEIDFRYGEPLATADRVMMYKALVKTVAMRRGLFASFMPKPIFGVNGSGMHVHQSLWKGGRNAFYDEGDSRKLSKAAYSFIAGQLAHAREMSGVLAPTVNSYKRLVPGYEAPVYVCWGTTNRSALIRLPKFIKGREHARRAELRCPDPSCNPYLAFAAMLAAGLDGIKRGLAPPEPVEEDVYELDDKMLAQKGIRTLPGSLMEASDELERSGLMKEALGEHVHSKLLAAQRRHWTECHMRVSQWELDRYLPVL